MPVVVIILTQVARPTQFVCPKSLSSTGRFQDNRAATYMVQSMRKTVGCPLFLEKQLVTKMFLVQFVQFLEDLPY